MDDTEIDPIEKVKAFAAHLQARPGALVFGSGMTLRPPVLTALLTRLAAAEGEIARRDAVSKASWGDQKDEHTDAIHAAHPTRTKDFETYDTALAMIGTRHGKYELVNLVNWLLVRAKAAEARVGVLEEALKPFAHASIDCDDDGVSDGCSAWESAEANYVNIGDFRRAAQALTQETTS